MSVDPLLRELIHAEVDGELANVSAADRAVLAKALLADPQARALREDLKRLRDALARVADVEPPAELRDHILRAVDDIGASTPAVTAPVARASWLRYAAAFAGGVAVTALVAAALSDRASVDSASAVGTLLPRSLSGHADRPSSLSVPLPGGRAQARVESTDDLLVLDVAIDSPQAVATTARFDPGVYEIAGWWTRDRIVDFSSSEGMVIVASEGPTRYQVGLRPMAAARARVQIDFESGGQRIGGGAIATP
jgi:hypothetical protein